MYKMKVSVHHFAKFSHLVTVMQGLPPSLSVSLLAEHCHQPSAVLFVWVPWSLNGSSGREVCCCCRWKCRSACAAFIVSFCFALLFTRSYLSKDSRFPPDKVELQWPSLRVGTQSESLSK